MYIPFRSRNFVSELEAYVYFKNQRTFRLVNDHSLTPPWCLTVAAVGHTFSTGAILSHTYIHTHTYKLSYIIYSRVSFNGYIYRYRRAYIQYIHTYIIIFKYRFIRTYIHTYIRLLVLHCLFRGRSTSCKGLLDGRQLQGRKTSFPVLL